MARQVLPIVGAAIGAYFGGPQGAQIGYMIGSVVGNAVDPLVVKGPQIGDSRVQTSAEVFRPIYFGTACGAGNIIMAGPDIKRTIEHDQGKGGGPVTTEERIYKTFAIAIGDGWNGPILGISRIWENEKLVYDTRPGSTMVAESAKFAQQFELYRGTEDQMPDEALEAIPAQFGGGTGNVSAFRGLAYIVFDRKDITPWMSIPQYRFEVVTEGSALPAVDTLLIRGNSSGFGYWKPSEDGIDWTADWTESDLLKLNSKLIATRDTYVAVRSGGQLAYLGADEANFEEGVGTPQQSVGGPKQGDYSYEHDRLMIARGLNGGIISSYDGGRNASLVDDGSSFSLVVWHDISLLWYSFDTSYNLRYRFNEVPAWSEPFPSGVSAAQSICACGRGPTVLIGGRDPLDSTKPRIADVAFTNVGYPALPTTTGSTVELIRSGSNVHIGNIDVAVLDSGEILYRSTDDPVFRKSSFTMPVKPTGLTFNGRRFLLCGGLVDADDEDGVVYSSEDGNNWTPRYTIPLGGNSFCDIESLALSAGQVTSGPIDLAEAVLRIHDLSGQSVSKVDASDLEGRQLGGFILSGDYTGQAAIGMLGSIFMFDSPEYDKQIHHRFRGKPVVRTITDDDLVDEPDDGTREDQIEFPRKLHLEAQNTASGYAPAKETSERESSDVRVVGELSVSAPLMFAGDAEQQASEQARTANILHKVAWEKARGKREIVVPDKYLTDVPGEAYMVNIRGRSDRMTIDRQNYVDGVLRLELSYDRASAYVSNRSGNTPSEQTPPPSTIVGATGMMVLDISALRDEDDINSAVRYVALGPLTPSWYGSEFGESLDVGSSYYRRMRRNSPGAVMGTLQADVAEASEHYTDRTNKVRVQLDLASYSERIEALTEQQFLSEGGAFALVNASDEVEVCQYMEVDDLGNGLLELSVLLRGRVNSGTFAFPAGSRFVLLSTTRPVTSQSSYIGREIWHRAVSFDSTGETATISQMDFQGNSQREWQVAHLLLERAGDVVTATAVPRHRFGTDVAPVQSANHIGYRWTATDGTNAVSGDTNSVTPSRAFNVTGWASPITVTVAQINRITGAGPTVSEEIA